MNKRQKIIVSIAGITIVLLALLGLTYAYYLTRIEGNTNTNSISITTADLKLKYDDGNGMITTTSIIPNTKITGNDGKTFTVTNTGNTKVENYMVVLEYAQLENVVPSIFKYPNDFEITLTCVSKNNTTNEVSGTCKGASFKWNNISTEMVKNDIESGIRHEYKLEIYYRDSGIDQSDDMNKNLNLKVQIYGSNDVVELTGPITGVEEGDAVFLNSEPKAAPVMCEIGNTNCTYRFIGVSAGTHKIRVIDKETLALTSESEITINKGSSGSITNTTKVVVTNETNSITTNIVVNGTSITSTISAIDNPYSSNTNSLAYNIIKNAIDNKNGTSFLNIPKTNIAESITLYGTGEFDYETLSTSDLCSGTAPWLVGDTPSAAQSGSGVSSYEDAVGKYVYDQCRSWTKYLDSYDSSTTTLTFKSETMADESTLSMTNDDYGTSYYYRGAVEDNYVTFAGMCWRIVRIAGDGSIKLILEDQDQPCSTSINGNWAIPTATGGTTYTGNFGYTQYNKNTLTASDGTQNSGTRYLMDYLNGQTDSDKSMATAFKNFQNTFTETELSKLKAGNWCLGDNAYDSSNNLLNLTQIMDNKIKGTLFYYDSDQRLGGINGYQPTLKCNGTIMNDWDDDETNPTSMYVGAITADEVAYAGGKIRTLNENYYLINEEFKKRSSGANKSYYFWSLSPSSFNGSRDVAFRVDGDGRLDYSDVDNYSGAFRPSVSLASSAVITGGEGTLESPYIIG